MCAYGKKSWKSTKEVYSEKEVSFPILTTGSPSPNLTGGGGYSWNLPGDTLFI